MTDRESEIRRCTNCGKAIEDLPYECWLFHTCRSCALEPAPDRWGDGTIGPGTYRKWRYFPRWHMVEHSETTNHWRTNELVTDGGRADSEVATQQDTVHEVNCRTCPFHVTAQDGQHGIQNAARYIRGKKLVHLGQYPHHDAEVREVAVT